MLQSIIINLVLRALKLSWFQAAMVKLVTSIADGSNKRVDDEGVSTVLDFISANKRSLVSISKKELSKGNSILDEQFISALEMVQQKKK